jgi:hypothetical protein
LEPRNGTISRQIENIDHTSENLIGIHLAQTSIRSERFLNFFNWFNAKTGIFMKALVSILALFSICTARADILHASNVTTTTVTGPAAQQLWNSLNVPVLRGDSLRTESSAYKVLRSSDGLEQTVCEQTVYYIMQKPSEYRCTDSKSTDGTQIPVFVPVIRMG